jgi:hypothetical protein
MEKAPMVRLEHNGRGEGAMRQRRQAASRSTYRLRPAFLALAVAITAGASMAGEFTGEEPGVVRDAIGGGIHAYHAGDFNRAYDDLTNAIEAGTSDPRSYYFRGLAALRLGRTSEADADFASGAEREATSGSIRRVSLSLERVQGPDRLALERFRARARLGALQREQQAYGRRYSAIEEATGNVRRRRRPEDIRPETVVPGVEEVPAPSDPAEPTEAEEPAAQPRNPKKPKPAVDPADKAEDDPFGDDPFGDEKPKGKGAMPAEKDMQDEESVDEVDETAAERDTQNEVESAADSL